MRSALAFALMLGSACASGGGEPDPRGPIAPRPSPWLRTVDDGIRAYKAERYAEAAWCLGEIVAGRIQSGGRDEAEFWLAKSYIRLNDHPRAQALFAAIARDPSHPFYVLSLPWLVHLRLRRPADPRLDQVIGGYPLSVLEHDEMVELVDDLRVAFAAHRLRVGDTTGAYALAIAVPPGTEAHREAQLIVGYVLAHSGREADAIDHFRIAAAPLDRPRRRRRQQPASGREVFDGSIRAQAQEELTRRGFEAP